MKRPASETRSNNAPSRSPSAPNRQPWKGHWISQPFANGPLPLAVATLGTWLGYGIWPNIVIGTTIAFFPMVVNTAVGLAGAEPEMLDLVRTLKASRWQVLRKIRFPNAVPYIFVGLKLAATMSVIGALVGEFVASERGLGSLIITGGVTLQTASIFASLILISAMGLVLYGLVVAVERIVAPWAHRDDATG